MERLQWLLRMKRTLRSRKNSGLVLQNCANACRADNKASCHSISLCEHDYFMNTSRKTLLHEWHVAKGAHMAEFAGWEMPLWYPTGAVAEHRSAVTAAGLFDTSHMDALTVAGEEAFDLLQECFTRDLRSCMGEGKLPLSEGACVYGAFLTEQGWVIDDAVVYRTGPGEFLHNRQCGDGSENCRSPQGPFTREKSNGIGREPESRKNGSSGSCFSAYTHAHPATSRERADESPVLHVSWFVRRVRILRPKIQEDTGADAGVANGIFGRTRL